ncbi:MAG TPA: phosphoribosylamine--glycine ligase family protein, partial [Pseudobdellovibrionaceae bacterium]|nr:phosphoribosylamine--glycine ligase family protein [Pseudobdellovibrionaceae bacterium]
MKFLILGQGGREHALIKSLYNSPTVKEIHAIPGSDGFQKMAMVHKVDLKKTDELIQFCLNKNIDVVIIGPEEPLVWGVADALRARGILVVGPNKEAAQLEGSKNFAK